MGLGWRWMNWVCFIIYSDSSKLKTQLKNFNHIEWWKGRIYRNDTSANTTNSGQCRHKTMSHFLTILLWPPSKRDILKDRMIFRIVIAYRNYKQNNLPIPILIIRITCQEKKKTNIFADKSAKEWHMDSVELMAMDKL